MTDVMFMTGAQMIWLFIAAMAIGAFIATWIVWLVLVRWYDRQLAPVRSELDSLRMQMDIELVTVTSHDAVTDNFVRTARFGTDLYAALAYCSQHAATYNLYLKVRRKSGEYIALNLINS